MDVRSLLAQTQLFAGIDEAALDQLSASTSLCGFRSGQTVFELGKPSDCLYVVGVGRLRVTDAGGGVRGDIGVLEWVGEVGTVSGHLRSAYVYAVRDSYLLRIERDDLLSFLLAHPDVMLRMAQVMIERLQMQPSAASLASARRPRCLALVPASPDLDLAQLAQQMRAALAAGDDTCIVDSRAIDAQLGRGRAQAAHDVAAEDDLVRHLQHVETAHRHLLYVADRDAGNWSQRCMRQCDRLLVVADARTPPSLTAMLDTLRAQGLRVPVELILLRPDGCAADSVLQWRQLSGARAHYYVRPGNAQDIAALTRCLTGRGLGLVLGGGGARGFAHIGLLRAMDELGLPIDVFGGSSMGAFVSALAACGHRWHDILEIARDTFVKRSLLNDYLVPRVALIRGRRFHHQLQAIFGERTIEELRSPYFCVSTNLTRGVAAVHDTGSLAAWVATSMAVPGVAPPVVYQGDLLVDGAVINSLPTDVMQSLERGPIIASDVSTEGALSMPGVEGPDGEAVLRWVPQGDGWRRPTLMSILFRTATLTSESGVKARASRADAYLRLPVSGVALFDWKKLDEMATRGYEFAMQQLPALRSSLQAPT